MEKSFSCLLSNIVVAKILLNATILDNNHLRLFHILTKLSFIPVLCNNHYTEQLKWDPIAHFDEYVA